jgi:hypothetical protein
MDPFREPTHLWVWLTVALMGLGASAYFLAAWLVELLGLG